MGLDDVASDAFEAIISGIDLCFRPVTNMIYRAEGFGACVKSEKLYNAVKTVTGVAGGIAFAEVVKKSLENPYWSLVAAVPVVAHTIDYYKNRFPV